MLNKQDATVTVLGRPDREVEADETEIGRKRKEIRFLSLVGFGRSYFYLKGVRVRVRVRG